ncbi:MAG: hypothetical protein ACE5FN_03435, partial [Leptospirillia bacterium]
MSNGGFEGSPDGPPETHNRWLGLLKAKKGHAPEGGSGGFGGTPMGAPRPPKTWQEREAEKWRELFSGGDVAEEAGPEEAGS